MKKFVTLALALVMALSLAAPALAFTGIPYEAPSTSQDVTLNIRLVDISTGYINVNFSAPPANRGYASGQLVCAVVDMTVAKGKVPYPSYQTLTFSGKNVSLWQDENFRAETFAASGKDHYNPATNLGGGVGMLRHVSKNVASAISKAIGGVQDLGDSTYQPFSYAANMDVDNAIIFDLAIATDDDGDSVAAGAEAPIFAVNAYDQTYQFAIFGRVLTDDASITATLKGTGALINANPTNQLATIADNTDLTLVPVKAGKFAVGYLNPNIAGGPAADLGPDANDYFAPSSGAASVLIIKLAAGDIAYTVTDNPTDPTTALPIFTIITDKNFKTKEMYVYGTSGTFAYRVQVVTDPAFPGARKASFWDDILVQFADPTGLIVTDSAIIAEALGVLEDVVVDVFGLDIRLIGTYMSDGWWAGDAEDSVTVKVEPWYAEVTVPPEIEIEIPKTGDALSVMGFVLIALAGLAVVAVRKVKA